MIIKKIFEFMLTHVKKPYYYVSPCPSCGSRITGRYVKEHRKDTNDWVIAESLKNGEIVRTCDYIDPEHSVFCLECGHEWKEYVPYTMRTLAFIENERKARKTVGILHNIQAQRPQKRTLSDRLTHPFRK